ncbi:MAG: glycosyltransferase [Desulfurococcaceae archaeon]
MKAYLLHLFNVAGGGEKVSLEIAYALRSRGFKVIYVTNSAKSMRKTAELLGLPGDYEVLEVYSILERFLGYTGRFIRLRRLLLLERGLKKLYSIRNTDRAITIDTSTNHLFNVDVSYIHYPITLSTYGAPGGGKLLYVLYDYFVKYKAGKTKSVPRLVLTNSSWTAQLLKKALNVDAIVLHPPVDVDYFTYDGRMKEKVIVTISRLTPEKNLHLIPRIASKLQDYTWYLIGSLGTTGLEFNISKQVLKKIESEIRRYNLRNLYLLTNVSRRELRDILLSASFYVHPFFPEHFGISVVEAISAGCIPIVYRDGGAWTDIVSQLDLELSYESLEEVPSIIRKLESKHEKQIKLINSGITYVKKFKAEYFRERFIETLRGHGLIT